MHGYHSNNNIDRKIALHHIHNVSPNQCTSYLVQKIYAPLPLVWSIIRRFDHPQVYKGLIKSCTMVAGSGGLGSIREVQVVSGLPAETSLERLDWLDDESYVMKFSIIGGGHRLVNYHATTTLDELYRENGGEITVVIESYVVDVPDGNSKEETCCFVDTIVSWNLKSLAGICGRLATYEQVCIGISHKYNLVVKHEVFNVDSLF